MIRTTALAGVVLAASMSLTPLAGTAFADGPIKSVAKGTATVGKGIVKGTATAGRGIVKGTGTVLKKTGKGVACVFTLGNRCG